MRTFIAIAWRNLWRNYSRSLIMIGGIGVGLFGLLVYYGISNGFLDEMVEVSIEMELGHIQVTSRGYHKNPVQSKAFVETPGLLDGIESVEGVRAAAGRLTAAVLVNSAGKSSRVDLVGIDPQREREITAVSSLITEGEYIQPGQDNKAVIGRRLAEHLGVGLGDRLVMMTQDAEKTIQSRLFRVGGIFKSNSPLWEKTAAFVTLGAMRELLGRPDQLTAVLVRAQNNTMLDPVRDGVDRAVTREAMRNLFGRDGELAVSYAGPAPDTCTAPLKAEKSPALVAAGGDLEVQTWKEVSPFLAQSIEMFDSFVWIFYLIIYLAMAFGVVNIMLMAVMDRTRELGVMRAVGTTPGQVMVMVLLEAALLGIAGIAVGGGAAWLLNSYLETNGLDLSYWSGAMEWMGLGSVIHPSIEPVEWVVSFVSAEAAVIISSIWPAWRSAKVEPVKALQFE